MKESSKLTKSYYKNGQQKSDFDKVLENFADCTNKITQTKKDYINKMTEKLQNPLAAPKTYWAILSRLLYNEKIPSIPQLLADGIFVTDFCEKPSLSNFFFFLFFFFHQYVHQYKIQVFYHLFYIGKMPEQLHFMLLKTIYY